MSAQILDNEDEIDELRAVIDSLRGEKRPQIEVFASNEEILSQQQVEISIAKFKDFLSNCFLFQPRFKSHGFSPMIYLGFIGSCQKSFQDYRDIHDLVLKYHDVFDING